MRTYSMFTILLLCLSILVVDIFAFIWLQDINALIPSENLRLLINIIYWVFTVALISSIIILKVRLDDINPMRKDRIVSAFFGLTVSSFIPKLLFVVIISLVHFANLSLNPGFTSKAVPLIGLLGGIIPFFVILNSIFRTLYRFKVYHKTIYFENLPKAFHDFRVVQISDLHLGSFNFRYNILERAVEIINTLKPHCIVITGDLVNNFYWELRGWDRVFKKLNPEIPKYAVLGNHDYGDYSEWPSEEDKMKNSQAIRDFFKDIGFRLLMNESEIFEKEGEQIAIIGVENWGKPPFKQYGDLNKAMQKTEDIPFKILLSHDPTHWAEEVVNSTDIALTLSGHTHGMQAGIQLKTKNWSPIKYKYEHWAGLYQNNHQYLYVNRGLGWLAFPGRLGMRPEIADIRLKRK